MLDVREVFDLMETASAAALVLDRSEDSLFDLLREAQAGGIVPATELAEMKPADAERLRSWMRGCALIARHGDDADWLSGQVLVRMCEARGGLQRRDFANAMLATRLAEFATAMLAKLLARSEAAPPPSSAADWQQIEGWR